METPRKTRDTQPSPEDQLELDLDDNFRLAEQYSFDFLEDDHWEKLQRIRRLLEV